MSDTHILSECRDGVLWVTINRAAQHNALSLAMLTKLQSVFRESAADQHIKLAVLTGAGERSFAAGGDLKELDAVRSDNDTAEMSALGMAALNAVREYPLPVVAVLNGAARGGGAELALACDLRLAVPSAAIGLIQGKLNLATAWGGGNDVMSVLGPAKGLITLGNAQMHSAPQALKLGLVDGILDDALPVTIQDYLGGLLARPRQVLMAHKALAQAARQGLSLSERQSIERKHLLSTWTHDDHWRAAATAFDKAD